MTRSSREAINVRIHPIFSYFSFWQKQSGGNKDEGLKRKTYLWKETHFTSSNRARPDVMRSSPKCSTSIPIRSCRSKSRPAFVNKSNESGAHISSLVDVNVQGQSLSESRIRVPKAIRAENLLYTKPKVELPCTQVRGKVSVFITEGNPKLNQLEKIHVTS